MRISDWSSDVCSSDLATLRSNRGDRGTRLRQLIEWMGEDFSGVIVFDEAHEMAGVAGGEGRFGATKGSEQGIAGVRLQNLAPRARILYASRSEGRRVGKEGVRRCRSRWSRSH